MKYAERFLIALSKYKYRVVLLKSKTKEFLQTRGHNRFVGKVWQHCTATRRASYINFQLTWGRE
jgi:hypothetical protein